MKRSKQHLKKNKRENRKTRYKAVQILYIIYIYVYIIQTDLYIIYVQVIQRYKEIENIRELKRGLPSGTKRICLPRQEMQEMHV